MGVFSVAVALMLSQAPAVTAAAPSNPAPSTPSTPSTSPTPSAPAAKQTKTPGSAANTGTTANPATTGSAPASVATPAEKAASSQAKSSGAPVEVPDQTTERVRVVANPDGTFTQTQYLHPVRVKQNGKWVPVDTTLVRRADGTVAPKAAVTTAVFSGGGDAHAVTLSHGDQKLALVWPNALPVPVLSGSSATYPNVLPGVDLQLNATSDSYTEVLVVHDATAAANPALKALPLTVSGTNLSVKADSDGSISTSDASGAEIYRSAPPIMWDSTVNPQVGPAPTAVEAGSGHVSNVGVTPVGQVHNATTANAGSSATVNLVPPAAALTGNGVHYPLFIDPWFTPGAPQYWVSISSKGYNTYDSGSLAKVGYCGFTGCNYDVMRSYFQMDTTALQSRNGTMPFLNGSYFYFTEQHSATCSAEPVDLYEAGIINSSTTWPGPLGRLIDERSPAGGTTDTGCSDHSGVTTFIATSAVQDAINHGWPNLTFGVRSPDETNDIQWKIFFSNPHLDTSYSFPPSGVSGLGVNGAVNCDGTNYVSAIGAQALTYNAVATDNNPYPLQLRYFFQTYNGYNGSRSIVEDPYGGPHFPQANSGAHVTYTTDNTTWYNDSQYSYRATVENEDSGPYPDPSIWAYTAAAGDNSTNYYNSIAQAPWYNFTVIQQAPPSPQVTSFDFPTDSSGNAAWGAPQGYGSFQLGNDADPDVVGYVYAFDNGGAMNSVTINDCTLQTPLGSTGRVPDHNGVGYLPVPSGLAVGHHTLYVKSFDKAHNVSPHTNQYQFMVSPNYGASIAAHLPATSAVTNGSLGKCLDDPNNNTVSGDIAEIWDCTGGGSQVWTLNANNTVTHGGLCLDIIGGPSATANGTKVQLYTCNGWANQQWQIQQDANGNWRLYNPNSGRCLDDPYATATNGTQLWIWDCNFSATNNYGFAQTWGFDLNPNRYNGVDQQNVTSTPSTIAGPTWQYDVGGANFAAGKQILFWGQAPDGNGNPTSTLTIPFTTPIEADYALGVRLTQATNYAQATFALVKPDGSVTKLTPANLGSSGVFDGYYSYCCIAQYVPLGGTHLAAATYQLRMTITDKQTASGGYGVGVDYLEVAPYANVTADSFAHSLNNHGISDDTTPAGANIDFASLPNLTDVGGTGVGDSLSSKALQNANLAPGTSFTLDGVNFTMPAPKKDSGGNVIADNTIAMGQTITLDPSQQLRGNAVGLLVLATNGGTPGSAPTNGVAATINYGAGGTSDIISNFPAVADWCSGPTASAAYTLAYRNTPSGKDTNCAARLYLIVLPAHPINNVQSITLPYYGTGLTPGSHNPALHVLAIGVRPAAGANLSTSADASGNNHPVTLSGRVGFDPAQQGGAAVFDGTGGFAATGGATPAVLDTTKSFSIAAWAELTGKPNGSETLVVQQATTASGFYLELNSNGYWQFVRPGVDGMNPSLVAAVSPSPAVLNKPTLLVGTWDSTGTMTLYVDVNGTVQTSTATDTAPIASNGPLVIGRGFANGAAGNFVTGEITDVQAYQRVLTAADVSTLNSSAVTSALATPAGWWQLEDFGRNWTGAWGAQPDGPAPSTTPALGGTTIRQVVHPSYLGFGSVTTLINGTYNADITGKATGPETSPVQTRIRLTNRFGSAPVTITAAAIAAQTSAGGAATGPQTTLTFGGPTVTSVMINPGAEVVSDPVTLPDTTSGSGNLVVSLALGAGAGTAPVSNQLTSPAYPVYQASGNQSTDATGAATIWSTNGNLTGRYYLSGLDVTDAVDPQATGVPGTIAILGDQVSGAGTPTTWAEMLGSDQNVFKPGFDPNNGPGPNPGGFVNLSDNGASVAGADAQFTAAPNATVLEEPNLKAVLVTLGLNDLKSGATAATIEGNINTLVSSLTPYGITNHYNPDGSRKVDVYLATIPDAPGLTAAQETERANLNTCITSQGATCAVKIAFGGSSNTGAAVGYLDIAAAVAGAGPNPTQSQINSAVLSAIDADNAMITTW